MNESNGFSGYAVFRSFTETTIAKNVQLVTDFTNTLAQKGIRMGLDDPVGGWPSMVCIICMVSGVQLFCLGIVGQYMSKTYMEVKKRPIYLVKEEL